MTEEKRGGKREGAGRKPTGTNKVPITLYVEDKAIWPFGNKDKLKTKLYDFISSNGAVAMVQDLTKATIEIKPQEPPKTNYSIDTTPKPVEPITTKFEAYRQQILKTTMSFQLVEIMKEVKAELMTGKEKLTLEAIAKEHSRTMYTD